MLKRSWQDFLFLFDGHFKVRFGDGIHLSCVENVEVGGTPYNQPSTVNYLGEGVNNNILVIVQSTPSPLISPSFNRIRPETPAQFQVPNSFYRDYVTPNTAVLKISPFSAVPTVVVFGGSTVFCNISQFMIVM